MYTVISDIYFGYFECLRDLCARQQLSPYATIPYRPGIPYESFADLSSISQKLLVF